MWLPTMLPRRGRRWTDIHARSELYDVESFVGGRENRLKPSVISPAPQLPGVRP